MHRKFVLAVLVGLILLSLLPYAYAQNNLNDFSDKQRVITAQQNVVDSVANDRAFWDSVKDSKNPDELRAYLEQFPSGVFAPLAKARLKTLEKGDTQSQSDKIATSTVTGPKEIGRDSRFIAYDNGTVLDTKTHLMWTAKDNGADINWNDAKRYCENYRGGGFSDWRMPTLKELSGLYDGGKTYQTECRGLFGTLEIYSTGLIRLTCSYVWASETLHPSAYHYDFGSRSFDWYNKSNTSYNRALPVRSAK